MSMPKSHNVFCDRPHGRPIVDAHPGRTGDVHGLVDDDDGKPALRNHRQVGIVVGRRVHHEPVDARSQHCGGPVAHGAARSDCHQEQPLTRFLT